MDNKIKVLVITKGAWNDSNNTGNTLSNIFSGMDCLELSNIFCSSQSPQNNVCKSYYRISEEEMLKSVFMPLKKIGERMEIGEEKVRNDEIVLNNFRKNRKPIYFAIREMIWLKIKWCNARLKSFLDESEPDIVFMPAYDAIYMHNIYNFVLRYTHAKGIMFFMDDYFSDNDSLDIISKLRLARSKKIVKYSVSASKLHYAISKKMCLEYARIFNIEIKLLYKGFKVDKTNDIKRFKTINDPIKILYAGNLMLGRWKTLIQICEVIDELNKETVKAELEIYSGNILNNKIIERVNTYKGCKFGGSIKQDDVKKKLKESDIVLHVESLDIAERLKTRSTFSTKIVDYLEYGKCIFCVGWNEAASIEYLEENDAAYVAHTINEIKDKLTKLVNNPALIFGYQKKAWECGRRNHDIKKIQSGLIKDFEELLNEDSAD